MMEAIDLFLSVFAVTFGVTGGIALAGIIFWFAAILIEWLEEKLNG